MMDNAASFPSPIDIGQATITIQSDALGSGWGGLREEKRTGGPWSVKQKELHINIF